MGNLPFLPTNNIMFTLMAGVLIMMAYKRFPPLEQGLILFATILITGLSDWMLFGPALIFAFYKYHHNPKAIKWIIGTLCALMLILQLPALFTGNPQRCLYSLGLLEVMPLLTTYNSQRGYSPPWVQWGFYAFYPLHLFLLWGIRLALFGY